MRQSPWFPSTNDNRKSRICYSAVNSQWIVKAWSNIADGFQFVPNPAAFNFICISLWLQTLCRRSIRFCVDDRFYGALSCKHSTLHCVMSSLDLWYIQKAGCTADQTTARKLELGNRLESAFD